MADYDLNALKPLAAKYVWWKTPEEALRHPRRVIAQVMNLGDYDDLLALQGIVGEDDLRNVLQEAEIGQFRDRSWSYWHVRLGLVTDPDMMPDPPRRRFA